MTHAAVSHDPDFRQALLDTLDAAGFTGDIETGRAARLTAGTDNSIYQLDPLAVVYPRSAADIGRVVTAAQTCTGGPVPICARGGGTGTNGQSLGNGITLDVSRHLNRVLDFNPEGLTVTVEPGIVLGELNQFLAPHGLFFPPTVSTGSRATIGGMVATDASGKGSRVYGKTSDYILQLDTILADGSSFAFRALPDADLPLVLARQDRVGDIHRTVHAIVHDQADRIAAVFPKLNRGLTGYNLQGVLAAGAFDMTRLLAGSEGTLAITTAITLAISKRPAYKALIVARYTTIDGTLRAVAPLLHSHPTALEVLDDKVLDVARQDVLWASLDTVLGRTTTQTVAGLSFIEFSADDAATLAESLAQAQALLARAQYAPIDWQIVRDSALIEQLWSLREKAVGLLGRLGGTRQGTAFVEDTAVPPERLADYVRDFRAILDNHGLTYGMFGHADVGCLHVRPTLDMALTEDAAKIRPVSDAVAQLTLSYGGLLWGEHGRGYRGEYSPLFFGPELFAALCDIKRAFDPLNLLNPGKLATPAADQPLVRIDEAPLRGGFNRVITPDLKAGFEKSIACNGNGACHNWDARSAMCPSFKATRDRLQSPKGRATALREWLRQRAVQTESSLAAHDLPLLESELKASLDTCLSCKACATQCPVQVDIPVMRARFLEHYYKTRRRPLRDRLLADIEHLLPAARIWPAAFNALLRHAAPARAVLERIGLVDLPPFLPSRRPPSAALFKGPAVVIMRDSFTASFDGQVEAAAAALLTALGYRVSLSPIWRTGKSAHVLGFTAKFRRFAQRGQALRRQLIRSRGTLISLDAATGLLFEQEYAEAAPAPDLPPVLSLEQFLLGEIERSAIPSVAGSGETAVRLLLHCTERTARPHAGRTWQRVLAHFGIAAEVPELGCCGMAGLFGHEREHADLSRRIFDLSWRPVFDAADDRPTAATGFSCRCQVKRHVGARPPHPVELLLARLTSEPS